MRDGLDTKGEKREENVTINSVVVSCAGHAQPKKIGVGFLNSYIYAPYYCTEFI